MSNGAKIRDEIIFKTLHEELVGPCPYGNELDVTQTSLIPYEDFKSPFVTMSTGEEILKVPPVQRYGAGVIYPMELTQEALNDVANTSEPEKELEFELPEGDAEELKIKYKASKQGAEENDDFDISLANARAPSSMGISFLLDSSLTDQLSFEVSGAFYKEFKVSTKTNNDKVFEETWWYRAPIKQIFTKSLDELGGAFKLFILNEIDDKSEKLLELFTVEGIIRTHENNKKLVTVVVVNRNQSNTFKERSQRSLFQTQLKIVVPDKNELAILPYPEPITNSDDDLSNQLLYRNAPIFAKGHGVASNWGATAYSKCDAVAEVFTENLPTFETPSISAEIDLDDQNTLEVSMAALSSFEGGSEGDKQIIIMLEAYELWINSQSSLVPDIPEKKLRKRAKSHIIKCQEALDRMNKGYSLIRSNSKITRAFELANKAMLKQQKHSPKNIRSVSFDEGGRPCVATPFSENCNARGIWRPFQIGFLLMCIQGAVDKTHPEREIVDLIWFPTGGGKTEAYLGLAAFILIYERLQQGESSDGVQVLMRYTLRLLTAQQLQRAATLICCLDVIRQEEEIPGKRFSIGLWVGGKNTPNKRAWARTSLRALKKNLERNSKADNPFLLDRCPYCATQMGIVKTKGNSKTVVGYQDNGTSVVFCCVDKKCCFHEQIPVFVIDEDVFDERPSIVIGTVDKFAMLAWKPEIRSIFGIGPDGKRTASPPQLIIQDELHLISGPLGSMVALYEPLIEKLCSESLDGREVKPKIVCATATTKGYQDQIRALYGRDNASIFPPSGLDAENSFFAKYARDKEGNLLPGRKYVGVCAPGLNSILTTQVRTQSALLFAANRVEIEKRDPWVTLLSFYNSIRELGGALTLFQSDIIGYLLEQKRRYPRDILPRKSIAGMELTSRLKDDDIPKAITDLEVRIDMSKLNKEFYSNMTSELKNLGEKYPDLSNEISQIIKSIESVGQLNLVDYYCLETIYHYLRNQKSTIKLPKNCRYYYSLCGNYVVQAFCLATSIIEVGVDIDRLSVMSIVGQPKTTAQYIQVSGRIGRNAETPGLVVTIYSNAKPRDKSHYEDFRAYHQRLYAKVEPSSVTPFSIPALKRGLAAITVANVRQFSELNAQPGDIPSAAIKDWANDFLKLRSNAMSEDEQLYIKKFFANLEDTWDKRTALYTSWGKLKPDSEPEQTDLLAPLGATGRAKKKLPCPTSMRNVDGESSLWISDVYADFDDNGAFDE